MPNNPTLTDREQYLTAEEFLGAFLQHYQINTVLDIGANKGQFGRQLRELNYQGEIHSFEPVRSTYEGLLGAAEDDELWQAYPIALGAINESRDINLANSSGYSSFLPPSESSEEHFGSIIQPNSSETVSVRTLDSFFSEHPSLLKDKNIFLKMDTQGYDLEVISGGKSNIGRIIGILSEIAFTPLYKHAPDHIESFQTYQEMGFGVAGFYPTHRDKNTLELLEAECFFINRSPK